MDKNNIKNYLTETFLSEEKKPVGLTSTEKVQADSKKSNDANQKEVAKEMKDYEKPIEAETEPVKYENGEKEEEFQDLATYNQGSVINLEPDNDPGDAWREKQRQAITGKDSTQGNSVDYANVIPEDQAGFTGKKANQKMYDNNKKYVKKAKEAIKGQEARLGVSTKSDTNDNYLKENKKQKMKRLVFKKEFKGIENALRVIPESYKVDGKEFHMTDGNEKYEIKWEGSLTEGRAVVLKASDKNLMTEDMEKMKHLMGYKSEDTLGTMKGASRLDENKKFDDVLGKTKNLLSEMSPGFGFSGEGNLESPTSNKFDNSYLDSQIPDEIEDFGDGTYGITNDAGEIITFDNLEDAKAHLEYMYSTGDQFFEGEEEAGFPDLTGDGEVTQADILKGRGVELDEGEMWDRDAAHRDTTDDTYYQDNWDELRDAGEEFIVYVDRGGERVEYDRFNDEGVAAAEVEKLAKIGVKAYY